MSGNWHILLIATLLLLGCQQGGLAQPSTPGATQAPVNEPDPVAPPTESEPVAPPVAPEAALQPKPGTSSVEGTVTDYVGDHPLPNATIVLTRIGEEHRRFATESNAQGKFAFRNVEPGDWDLTISAKEMVSQTDIVHLDKDKVKVTKIALEELEAADVLKVAGKRKLVHPETARVETHLDKTFLTEFGNGNNLRKVIETAPGVMTDSFGNIVTRGEHDAVN